MRRGFYVLNVKVDIFRNQSQYAGRIFAGNHKNTTNMNTLPVSKKVYTDIRTRIGEALAGYPSSVDEALRMIDQYLTGTMPQSHNNIATIAFAMIRAELDRAIVRSRRARARAAARKKSKAHVAQPAIMLSRQQRRAQARAAIKLQKIKARRVPAWNALCRSEPHGPYS